MGIENLNLRVVHFTDKRIADPAGKAELPWRIYQSARNSVLEACRQFGSVGPMETCPIAEGVPDEIIEQQWKGGDFHATFFVLDDQLNNERYLYVEILNTSVVTTDWVSAIVKSLENWPGWGVCITNIREGYLIILPSVLLVTGPMFKDCKNVQSVIEACSRSLDVT